MANEKLKEKIDNCMRFLVLFVVMTMGFFFIYALAWFAIGLPQTYWALVVLLVLACLSEFGYVAWVSN